MEIHKPKPWHGLREFLKEYLIIVVGVLTALGAEQGVEWLHWQEKVARGREREVAELNALYYFSVERNSVAACLDRRLSMLRDALMAGNGEWRPFEPAMHNSFLGDVAYFTPTRSWREESWKALVVDGTVNHLSDSDMQRYSLIYAQAGELRAQNETEIMAADTLGVLLVPGMLTRSERNQLIATIERLRLMNRRMTIEAAQLMGNIGSIAPVDRARTQAQCDISNTHRACASLGFASPAVFDPPQGANDLRDFSTFTQQPAGR